MEMSHSVLKANYAPIRNLLFILHYHFFPSDHGDSVNLLDATPLKVDGKEMILVVTASTGLISTWLVCPKSGKHALIFLQKVCYIYISMFYIMILGT